MELIFTAEGLVEVRLDYAQHAGKDLNTKEFAKVLGEPEVGRDALRRKVEKFRDGDLIIEAFEKRDKYRRVFRELRFSSAPMMASLGGVVEERENVELALGRGMENRAAKSFANAKKSFEKALKTNASTGAAHVWLGMLALPEERFDEVEKQALAALETSRDRRVHAEAQGLLAVVALYNGKKRIALARFKEASAMDPANAEVAKSAEELKTGNYQPERVAKTAARFECLAKAVPKSKKKKAKATPLPWTEQGLLARGNFPDLGAYVKALADSANTQAFRDAKKLWASWECR
jgi:tetratricopeptide (TPR) repeat protein